MKIIYISSCKKCPYVYWPGGDDRKCRKYGYEPGEIPLLNPAIRIDHLCLQDGRPVELPVGFEPTAHSLEDCHSTVELW